MARTIDILERARKEAEDGTSLWSAQATQVAQASAQVKSFIESGTVASALDILSRPVISEIFARPLIPESLTRSPFPDVLTKPIFPGIFDFTAQFNKVLASALLPIFKFDYQDLFPDLRAVLSPYPVASVDNVYADVGRTVADALRYYPLGELPDISPGILTEREDDLVISAAPAEQRPGLPMTDEAIVMLALVVVFICLLAMAAKVRPQDGIVVVELLVALVGLFALYESRRKGG